MPSTYSDLKFELMATGEKAGTWGAITNQNIDAIQQAIGGAVDITFASADVTLTLINSPNPQDARALRLNLIGVSGGSRNLILPGARKFYIVKNNLADQVTIKNSSGATVVLPAGKTTIVYNTSTDIVDMVSYLSDLELGSPLIESSGGTGFSSYTIGDMLYASGVDQLSKLTLGTQNYVLVAGPTGPQYTNSLINVGVLDRVVVVPDGTSVTINGDTTDIATQANSQAAGTLTINAPSGTPANGQKLIFRLLSANVQTFSWNAVFQGSTDLSLPTVSSGASKYDYFGFMYNSTATKWQLVARVMGF